MQAGAATQWDDAAEEAQASHLDLDRIVSHGFVRLTFLGVFAFLMKANNALLIDWEGGINMMSKSNEKRGEIWDPIPFNSIQFKVDTKLISGHHSTYRPK